MKKYFLKLLTSIIVLLILITSCADDDGIKDACKNQYDVNIKAFEEAYNENISNARRWKYLNSAIQANIRCNMNKCSELTIIAEAEHEYLETKNNVDWDAWTEVITPLYEDCKRGN